MAGGSMVRRLAAMLVAGLVCGIVLAGPAHAQKADDPAALNAEVVRLYQAGKYAEATEIAKRLLAIREKALGPEHPHVGISLNNLAALYRALGRYAEAEPLYKRSLAIHEKALGSEHPGTTLNGLASLYHHQGRYAEAEPLFKRSLAIWEKALGPEHPYVGISLNNLAGLYKHQGRYAEAEPLYRRSLAIREKALGPEHPDVGNSLNNLAMLYENQGRYAEAEPLFKRSLSIFEKALGPEHPDVSMSLSNLASLAYVRSDWARAGDYWRRSTVVIERRAERGLGGNRGEASGGEAQRLAWRFWGLVKTNYRLAPKGLSPSATVAADMFKTAQWAQGSETAASLLKMAARSAKGSPQLAEIVRERQDLVGEWQGEGQAAHRRQERGTGKA